MIDRIRKAAVLGAGVMGSGIAAHLANAGIPCLMLDIIPPNPEEGVDTSDPKFRNRFTLGALEKLKKSKPAALFTTKDLELIEIGNITDDLHKIADCDWVVEVAPENMAIKQDLFTKIEKHRRAGAIISSNTSGLSIAGMLEGRSDDFRKHFLVTHFFNPVRYMKLLELVPGDETEAWVMDLLASFGSEVLGKGIVYGKDTTNFIANRIGVYGMMKTLEEMRAGGYTVTEVDKIFGPATGRPKSAVFRTADLVGLDTFTHVAKNCYDTLTDDPERDVFKSPDFLNTMVENRWLGGKTGQGFYKKTKVNGKRAILALNLDTMEYEEQDRPRFASLGAAKKVRDVAKRVKTVLDGDDRASELARKVTYASLAYSAQCLGEIADDVVNIDRAMRWGFNWDLGPFETWDGLGVADAASKMKEAGIDVPGWVVEMLETGHDSFYSATEGGEPTYYDVESKGYKPVPRGEKQYSLGYLKQTQAANKVLGNDSATLWDIGDGILCFEMHSALNPDLNPIDDALATIASQALDELESNYKGLVLYHDGERAFSAGANLVLVGMYSAQKQWDKLREMVTGFQQLNQRLRYSSKPVVVAPSGLALGGGAELVLAGNAVEAWAELYIGLVEVGVGLIPGGAGNLNLLKRWYTPRLSTNRDFDPTPFIKNVFMSIGMGQVAEGAVKAREAGFLRDTDGITLNRDHLLHAAKQRALGMYNAGFTPPRPSKFRLPGPNGFATIDMLLWSMMQDNQISAHDRLIGSKLASVLTGGQTSLNNLVTEDHLLELECEAFISLCGEPKTQERMQYMVMNNKPLRN